MQSTKKSISSVGRRREAISRVRLTPGKAASTVNLIAVEKYFPGELSKIIYAKPFAATDTVGKYSFEAKVTGGGKEGQLEATILSIARCLVKLDESNRPALRAAGLLTVDARIRQRRHIGTGGKARRGKQSPRR